MSRTFRIAAALFIPVTFVLCACSGPIGQNNGGGGGTPGTSKLVLTMTDAPPTGTSILGSPIAIRNLAIDQSNLGQQRLQLVPAGQTMALLDAVRLQSDSTFAGSFDVINGPYKAVFVDFFSPSLVYFSSGSTTVTVSDAQGFGFSGGIAFPTGNGTPLSATFGGQTQTASVDLNQSAFITTSASQPSLLADDFLQPNAANLIALPHSGVPSGKLEFVEDFIGTVTAVSGNTVTIQRNGIRASGSSASLSVPLPLVATANASTRFDSCTTATIVCVHTNQIVSVDAVVNSDGTLTLLELDDLSDSADEELEGTIASIDSTNQLFTMVVADEEGTNNSGLTNLDFTGFFIGEAVQVGLATGATFSVDTKGLAVPTANLNSFTGFSNLAPGQTVRIKVASTTGSQFNASNVALRFSRLTGKPVSVTNPTFTYDSATLPPYFALTGTPQVQTFGGFTLFDGVSDLTGVTAGDSISIRALYFPNSNPTFFAAKVRKH